MRRTSSTEQPPAAGAARRRRRWPVLAVLSAAVVAGAGGVTALPQAQAGVTAAAAGAVSGGSSGSTGSGSSSGGGHDIVWGECPALPAGASRDPRQACGTLRVPMDYRRPDGATIEIAVSRIKAADPERRRGVMLLNPGGPGGPGLDLPTVFASLLPTGARDQYDLIGFDPRGVGHSTPLTCGRDISEVTRDQEKLIPFPGADGSIAESVAYGREIARRCGEAGGSVLPFITTANTARDMDRIRAALGERRVSYYGLSYGTYLGSVYATLFPQRTDRMVLDSSVDPKLRDNEDSLTFGPALEDRFPDLARYATTNHDTVGYGRTAKQVRATFLAVADRLQRHPATVPGTPVPLTGNLLRFFTVTSSYQDGSLPELGRLWHAAAAFAAGTADAADATAVRDRINALGAAAQNPGVPDDNFNAAAMAVLCNDSAWPRDLRGYARGVARDRIAYPLTAGMPANVWPCTFWPVKPIEPLVEVGDKGPRNVLILQNRRDPATPLSSARGMRAALGKRAVLVDIDAGGHGVIIHQEPNACATSALERFLAEGKLPKQDTTCTKS